VSRESRPMSRRAFGRMLAGIVVAPPSMAIAQASKVVRRIGVLEQSAPSTPEEIRKEAEPLRDLGWVEGQNLHVERRYANGRFDALQPLAEELVRAQVEIIVTGGTPATLAAKRATTTIPIVIRTAGDPVLLGLVASLARPGGNVTGYSHASPEVTAKYLSLLKELLPQLQRIGVLLPAGNPTNRSVQGRFENICQLLALEGAFVEVAAAGEIEGAMAQLVQRRAQALVLLADSFVWDHRFEIVDAATKHGLPTMADASEMARGAGALIAYSTTLVEQDRRRAEYIDRILRGAKPADLPVQQPTKFELVINLKTARALGLTIPKELLLRADEVVR
jgi:putative tryptophan/tyrosine transport system substrate-binding protein